MASEGGHVVDISLSASTGLTSNQHYIVRSTGGDTCLLCTGASGGVNRAFGVLQNEPANAQAAEVRIFGLTKVVVGGSITAGDLLACSTAGTAVTASTTGQYVIGKALSGGSTATSQVITMLFQPTGVWMGSTA